MQRTGHTYLPTDVDVDVDCLPLPDGFCLGSTAMDRRGKEGKLRTKGRRESRCLAKGRVRRMRQREVLNHTADWQTP